MLVLFRRAEEGGSGRIGAAPSLAVVDLPGMHHHQGRLAAVQVVVHLNDPPRVVAVSPGAHMPRRLRLTHQRGSTPALLELQRGYELGPIGQHRPRGLDRPQSMLVDALLGRKPRGSQCPRPAPAGAGLNNGKKARGEPFSFFPRREGSYTLEGGQAATAAHHVPRPDPQQVDSPAGGE